ncbi:cytokinin dehydrogenase 2-like [Mangifera indica]|uniref:cytokinin dehydrogenase 2-like n=1 Tax=Mangifera indica TaxID=29780 RepID=UPI001CFA41D7|nr:cytokinin dehydrogenase 2-like [Mangifera indica]
MAVNSQTLIFFMLISMAGCGVSSWAIPLPPELSDKLHSDAEAIKAASTDYGHIISVKPSAVLFPSSVDDIKTLISFSFRSNSTPYTVAAKGNAHSVWGQAMAAGGVVVDMLSLNKNANGSRIVICGDEGSGFYADVGGEQLWIDLLNATLKHGLSPVSWTDYLYATVGGTLSNAGISGQTHRRGPEISNVEELDVVTGKGDLVTCSPQQNPDLFYGVLGGLGQFGVITRARIVLEPAKKRVKWLRILYNDFAVFTKDQESLIAVTGKNAPDYLEGQLLMDPNTNLEFFPPADRPKIISLIKQYGIIYFIEVGKYYDGSNNTVDEELKQMLKNVISFIPGCIFMADVTYLDFLNRVHPDELALREKGLWDVPHPWLNLFVPKSRIIDFDNGVFKDILLKNNFTTSLVLFYPMFRDKWDLRMSAVIPDEDVFYAAGFLDSSRFDNWEVYDKKNKEILLFCASNGIKVKQYLGHHGSKQEWIEHFGSKWNTFQQRKFQFDPKFLLSPGQKIFN